MTPLAPMDYWTPSTGKPVRAIAVAGPSNMAVFGVLATGLLPDLHLMGPGQQTRTLPKSPS